MEVKAAVLLCWWIGVCCVLVLGAALRQLRGLGQAPSGRLLALSHTFILCGLLAASASFPTTEGLYLPYLVVPGFPIFYPTALLLEGAMPWMIEQLGFSAAEALCRLLGPALIGLLLGGLQWYVVGRGWDWLRSRSHPQRSLPLTHGA